MPREGGPSITHLPIMHIILYKISLGQNHKKSGTEKLVANAVECKKMWNKNHTKRAFLLDNTEGCFDLKCKEGVNCPEASHV